MPIECLLSALLDVGWQVATGAEEEEDVTNTCPLPSGNAAIHCVFSSLKHPWLPPGSPLAPLWLPRASGFRSNASVCLFSFC